MDSYPSTRMDKRFWWILGAAVAVLVLLVAGTTLSLYLKSQLVAPPGALAQCNLMDVTKDGRVTASADLSALRAYINDGSSLKDCTDTSAALSSIAACQTMDVTQDSAVNADDEAALAQYLGDGTTLRLCVSASVSPVPTPVDPIAQCQLMDVSNDGRVTASGDLGALRAYVNNAATPKNCSESGASAATCTAMDVIPDGTVDTSDVEALMQYLGTGEALKTCPVASAVPLATPVDPIPQCQTMDVSKDGRVTVAGDLSSLRTYINTATTLKNCNESGASAGAITGCTTMDVTHDNTVNTGDDTALTQYLGDSSSLRVCLGATPSPSPTTCSTVHSQNLAAEISHQIDNRVAGLTASATTKNIFTTRGDGTTPWVRNPDVWTNRGAAPIDVTGVSPWNSNLGYRKAGTLVSPRHIVFAAHSSLPVGATIIFVDTNNTVVTRTIESQQYVTLDIRIAKLDADVPPSITYYPVLSKEALAQYLNVTNSDGLLVPNVPILTLDQEDHAIVRDAKWISNTVLHVSPPTGTDRKQFDEAMITGDSGDAGFFLINNKPVLIMTHWGSASGVFYGYAINEVNQAMTNLGGGYQLTQVGLSCFMPIATPTPTSTPQP